AVPAGQVLPLPENWSMAEGATLPETFFTVQLTLVDRAGLRPGQSVLVHGGAGGIGGTAIQMARLHGAVPFAVVSTPEKAEYALSLGAQAAILHRTEDFVEAIRALTNGRGADVVVDVVGGENTASNLRAVAEDGTIIQLSALGGQSGPIKPALIARKRLTWFGSTLRPQSAAVKARIAASLRRDVWPAIADGRIRMPRIRSFALEDAAAAHRAFEASDHFGKIVLEIGP
ncbi:MAG TPA: zinc-binding dehydrogenase, partial [Devosiaceae bacterium]|nr:zinc-binding dehydrogenase [Devosiaceae bacterium]